MRERERVCFFFFFFFFFFWGGGGEGALGGEWEGRKGNLGLVREKEDKIKGG